MTFSTRLTLDARPAPSAAAGCSARSDEGAPAGGRPATGPLVWFSGEITQGANDLRWAMRDAFERAEPGINVNVVSGPQSTDSMRDTMVSVLGPGAAEPNSDRVDVYLGDVIWPAQFGASGYALALDQPQTLGRAYFDRFAPELVTASQYQGHMYAAPFYTEQGLLYYRADILSRNGIAPPATWEDLVSAAQALKTAGESTYQFAWQGADYEGLTCNWIEYLADALGKSDPAADRRDLTSDASVNALTFMQELINGGTSPFAVTEWQEVQSIDAFSGGQAAFLRGWNSSWSTLLPDETPAAKNAKVGIVPLPRFRDTPGGSSAAGFSTAGGWSVFVNPRTDKLGASLAFVRWLTDVQAQRLLLTQGALEPAVTAVENDPAADAVPTLAAARRARLAVRPANDPAYPQVTQALHTSIHDVLTGKNSPPAALKSAADKIAQV
jgi:multiple sugar transport system substrate-binding protein